MGMMRCQRPRQKGLQNNDLYRLLQSQHCFVPISVAVNSAIILNPMYLGNGYLAPSPVQFRQLSVKNMPEYIHLHPPSGLP